VKGPEAKKATPFRKAASAHGSLFLIGLGITVIIISQVLSIGIQAIFPGTFHCAPNHGGCTIPTPPTLNPQYARLELLGTLGGLVLFVGIVGIVIRAIKSDNPSLS